MKIALTKNQLEVRFFALALSAKLLPQYAIGQLAAAIGSKASACVVFFWLQRVAQSTGHEFASRRVLITLPLQRRMEKIPPCRPFANSAKARHDPVRASTRCQPTASSARTANVGRDRDARRCPSQGTMGLHSHRLPRLNDGVFASSAEAVIKAINGIVTPHRLLLSSASASVTVSKSSRVIGSIKGSPVPGGMITRLSGSEPIA
jgi:hypothetical protein